MGNFDEETQKQDYYLMLGVGFRIPLDFFALGACILQKGMLFVTCYKVASVPTILKVASGEKGPSLD